MLYNLLQYNYTDSVLEAQARAFSNFMKPANYDPEAMMGLFLDYTGGVLSVNNALWYTKPVASPAVYKAFTKIPNTPIVSEIVPVADVVTKFGEIIPAIENRLDEPRFKLNSSMIPANLTISLVLSNSHSLSKTPKQTYT